MLSLLPGIALFLFCLYGYGSEMRTDRHRFLKEKKKANQHVLDEVSRFLNERELNNEAAPASKQPAE